MNKTLMYLRQFQPLVALRLMLFAVWKRLLNPEGITFYSQLGEDQFILSLLCEYCEYESHASSGGGFYLDIGSNHPIRFSNTFGLYCKGWRGICIDANLDLVKEFKKVRKLDHVIHAAISDEEKEVDFFVSKLDLVSTMDIPFREKGWVEGNFELKEKRRMNTVTLNRILDNLPKEEETHLSDRFDLLSVDVEGHDLNVLKSINLEKYRPAVIVVEMHKFDEDNPSENGIYNYLDQNKYDMVGYHIINGFFIARELKDKKRHAESRVAQS